MNKIKLEPNRNLLKLHFVITCTNDGRILTYGRDEYSQLIHFL